MKLTKILFVGAEALPFAATGGLGDVMGSLPAALAKAEPECDVRAVMPFYSKIKPEYRKKAELVCVTGVTLAWRRQYCGIFRLLLGGVTWYFIDNEYYFSRPSLYGEYDDGERFAFFSAAVPVLMQKVGFFPDVVHLNDWQSALAAVYLKTKYSSSPDYSAMKVVYTIHNIEYQGVYGMEIAGDVFSLSSREARLCEWQGALNLTKGAIAVADRVTTVSPTYSREIQTEELGHGLAPLLRAESGKLSGIINGIDYDYYNPAEDKEIAVNYSFRSLSRKAENKAALCASLGLKDGGEPLLVMITRLVAHKGLDLVKCVADELVASESMKLIVLGTGDGEYQDFFCGLQKRYPEKVRAIIAFDKELAKRLYASADLFLMPSKAEACGLAQMICSRYGTVPIVRETGGLYDSIAPYNKYENTGCGFTFTNYNAHDMLYVVREALALYRNEPQSFAELRLRAAKTDFSWKSSAQKYLKLYKAMIK